MTGRLAIVVPTYDPVGGVVKMFDYAVHGLELGWEVVISAPNPPEGSDPIWDVPRFGRLRPGGDVAHLDGLRVATGSEDATVFSWPDHWLPLIRRMDRDTPHARLIHLVQNVRHANPAWRGGGPRLLLRRPLTRIYTNDLVAAACEPLAHRGSVGRTIHLGHDTSPFVVERSGRPDAAIRVASVTWKSGIGRAVAGRLAGDERFAFRFASGITSWGELAELYRWCDVFLAAPGPEEGFYLPGLEAMAAGALVITPDVGGNMAYCRPGENCVLVGFEDAGDYVAALEGLARADTSLWETMREHGRRTVDAHGLDLEREAFGEVLDAVAATPARRGTG